MFSSKSVRGKWTWALVDLLVVIIGVYIAFLIQSSAANEKDKKEKEKVFTALKYEMEHFRLSMPGMSKYVDGRVKEFLEVSKGGNYANYTDWRFIQPQYSYQIIEYAINVQNSDIVDFELYDNLQKLYVEIKKLEHAESMIMETSMRYQSIPKDLAKTSSTYQTIWANNYDNYQRFITFMNDRGRILQAVADASNEALPLINQELGLEKSKEIERDIMLSNASQIDDAERAVAFAKQAFPNFTEEEIREIILDAKNNNSNTDEKK